MNGDQSAGANIRHVRARALAAYRAGNPNTMEGGVKKNVDSSIITVRNEGLYSYTRPRIGVPNLVDSGCCLTAAVATSTPCTTPEITNFTFVGNAVGPFSPPYNSFSVRWLYTWDLIPNTTSVSATTTFTVGYDSTVAFNFTSNSSLYVYSNNDNYTVTLTVRSSTCSPSSAESGPCFLAGTPVLLASGYSVPIENVRVGDLVIGAFGELNTVLALHRPLLGNNTMTVINNEHHTSSHHPHVAADRGFYSAKPAVASEQTYGRSHPVIDASGVVVERYLEGLRPERLRTLTIGVELKTIEGKRTVTAFENYNLPPETQLYNLVLDGSHTYHVDGYAVTGWPSESDFDYDTWNKMS